MRAFKILMDPYSQARITLHPECAELLGMIDKNSCNIKFGRQCQVVEVVMDTDLSPFQIGISEKVLWDMRLPRIAHYMIIQEGEDYRIGPYVGILATATNDQLRVKLESLKSFVHSYDDIGGAILVFSLEGINEQAMSIDGYVFNPDSGGWVAATYYYPDAVFSIVELSLTTHWHRFISVMEHLQMVLQNRVFNYPIFNKMEMYEWLTNYAEINKHLPETFRYQSSEQLVGLLKKYKKLYIKPITGRLAKGVIEVSLQKKAITVKFRHNRKNHFILFHDYKKLGAYFEKKLNDGEYLIQRGLNLISYNGRIIDFRLMLLKNERGNWTNVGVFGRFGAKESIVSNITAGGLASSGEKTIRKVLGVSQFEANRWLQKMNDLSIICAKAMEEYGIHGGNFGLDLAIDRDNHLWLIEINNQNPDPYIALSANRGDIFLEARKYNMLYLKRLAGFIES